MIQQDEIEKAAEEWLDKQEFYIPLDKPETLTDVLKTTFSAGAEHAKPRWVKCSERLPKEAMDVLALDAHGFARVVYWQTNDKWTDSEDGVSETQFRQWYTHWTTLPPAPEAESK